MSWMLRKIVHFIVSKNVLRVKNPLPFATLSLATTLGSETSRNPLNRALH